MTGYPIVCADGLGPKQSREGEEMAVPSKGEWIPQAHSGSLD